MPAVRVRSLEPSAGGSDAPAGTAQSAAEPSFSVRRLQSCLVDSNPLRANSEFASLLETVDTRTIEQAVLAFESLPREDNHFRELQLLLYKWGTLDGEAAAKYVSGMESQWRRGQLMHRALAGWADADPDAALAWAEKNHEGEDNPYIVGVIQGVAPNDLERATELAMKLPAGNSSAGRRGWNGSNWGLAMGALVNASFQNGTPAALNWAENLPEGESQSFIVSQVARRYSQEDPRAAADWQLDTYRGDDKASVVRSIAWRWVHDGDAADAASWISELGDAGLRAAAMSGLADQWGRHNPEATANWLNETPSSPEKDAALTSFASRLQWSDPKTALSWAVTISDEAKRSETISSVIRNWERRNPKEAKSFLAFGTSE